MTISECSGMCDVTLPGHNNKNISQFTAMDAGGIRNLSLCTALCMKFTDCVTCSAAHLCVFAAHSCSTRYVLAQMTQFLSLTGKPVIQQHTDSSKRKSQALQLQRTCSEPPVCFNCLHWAAHVSESTTSSVNRHFIEFATGPYTHPDKSNPHPPILFLQDAF